MKYLMQYLLGILCVNCVKVDYYKTFVTQKSYINQSVIYLVGTLWYYVSLEYSFLGIFT